MRKSNTGLRANSERMRCFCWDQLKSALDMGFGVKSAEEITLTPLNDGSKEDAQYIENVLKAPVAMH